MPLENSEKTLIRMKPGTLKRIKKWLAPNESRAEFLRKAVDHEIIFRARSADDVQ